MFYIGLVILDIIRNPFLKVGSIVFSVKFSVFRDLKKQIFKGFDKESRRILLSI